MSAHQDMCPTVTESLSSRPWKSMTRWKAGAVQWKQFSDHFYVFCDPPGVLRLVNRCCEWFFRKGVWFFSALTWDPKTLLWEALTSLAQELERSGFSAFARYVPDWTSYVLCSLTYVVFWASLADQDQYHLHHSCGQLHQKIAASCDYFLIK